MMMMTMMMMVMLMMMMGVMMVMEMAMIETNEMESIAVGHPINHSQTSPCGLLRNEVQQLHDGVQEMMHDAPCGVSVA